MLASFYRRFVPGFASRADALQQLLRKDAVFKWGKEEVAAFEDLKSALTTELCLILPDFELPFTLVTDAAQITGMGAVLMQDKGKGNQPIAYWSKSMNDTQRKYCLSESECLAMIKAVQVFRPYLYGRKFTLETDHKALEWLMTKHEPTGELSRWAIELQAYDFVVKYRKGSENVVADALSRYLKKDEQALLRVIRIRGLQALQMSRKLIGAAQKNDEWVQAVEKKGRVRTRTGETWKVSIEDDDIIPSRDGDGNIRILLPACLRGQVLQASHDSVYGGHFAVQRTMDHIETIYVMDKVFKHTVNWIAGCPDCGARKVKPVQVIPHLRAIGIGAIGDKWILDLIGPLVGTQRGNSSH